MTTSARAFRFLVGAVCAYEAVACFTRLKTISEWIDEHPGYEGALASGAIVGGLVAHWAWTGKESG